MGTLTWTRNKQRGLAQRGKLRALVVPRLYVGCRLPSQLFLARLLGISAKPASLHMARVLREEGITIELRGRGKSRRNYVTALPERLRDAA